MGEYQIEKRIVKKEEFFIKCPFCPKEISGSNADQIVYNLDIHINAKHKDRKK